MNKKLKIALIVGIPLIVGIYLILKKPKFQLKSVDWIGKRANIKFGSKEYNLSNNEVMKLPLKNYYIDVFNRGSLMFITLFDSKNNPLETITIDFDSKLIY